MLGTSDAWSKSHLSQRTSEPANQRTSVLYCRLSDFLKGQRTTVVFQFDMCSQCTIFSWEMDEKWMKKELSKGLLKKVLND